MKFRSLKISIVLVALTFTIGNVKRVEAQAFDHVPNNSNETDSGMGPPTSQSGSASAPVTDEEWQAVLDANGVGTSPSTSPSTGGTRSAGSPSGATSPSGPSSAPSGSVYPAGANGPWAPGTNPNGSFGPTGPTGSQYRSGDLGSQVTANNTPAGAPSNWGSNSDCKIEEGKICNPIKAKSLTDLVLNVMSIVKFLAGIVLVFYFMWAGFKYVTARGDTTKIQEATRMLTWTAVGGAILLGAEVIAKLIKGTIDQLGTGL